MRARFSDTFFTAMHGVNGETFRFEDFSQKFRKCDIVVDDEEPVH